MSSRILNKRPKRRRLNETGSNVLAACVRCVGSILVLALSAHVFGACGGKEPRADPAAICNDGYDRMYAPEPTEHGPGANCGPHCKQVTFQGSVVRYDTWGDYIAYCSIFDRTVNERYVYLADVTTGEEWLIDRPALGSSDHTCSALAVGQRNVAFTHQSYFVRDADYPGADVAQILRLFDISTQTYAEVACIRSDETWESLSIGSLYISENRLYYPMCGGTDFAPGFKCLQLYEMDLAGLETGELFRRTEPPGISDVVASNRVVAFTDWQDSDTEIAVFNVGSGEAAMLTDDDADQWEPRIHGERVVWVDHRNDDSGDWMNPRNTDIYYSDLRIGDVLPVCADPAIQQSPDIHGDRVVWTDYRNNPDPVPDPQDPVVETTDIYLRNLSTDEEDRVTDFAGIKWAPRIIQDRLFFKMAPDGSNSSVFMIDLSLMGF